MIQAVSRRLLALVAAVVTAAAALTLPAGVADAQTRNLVVFGDSVIANPTVPEYLAGGLSSNVANGQSSRGSSGNPAEGCPQGDNWGRGAAQRLGMPAWDYSCSGAVSMSPGPQFSTQVDTAIRTGGLTDATERVIISTGFNDTYNNVQMSDGQLTQAFVAAMAPQVERIKQAAPNARIQIVGYPSITAGDHICLFHVGPNVSDRTYVPQVNQWQWQAQEMQIALANATGVEFLNLKPSTSENHMCAPDDKRMWAGLVDFYAGPGNLPFHVNDRGHAHVAHVIAHS